MLLIFSLIIIIFVDIILESIFKIQKLLILFLFIKNYNKQKMQPQKQKQKFRDEANPSQNVTEKRKHSKSPKKISKKILLPSDHKTLFCQITRLKGQEKLLYIKQCKQKKISDQHFFQGYPYCKLESFVFNIQAVQQGGKIIRDQNGLHWIQQNCPHHPHLTHAVNGKNYLNGWGISILNDGKIFQGVYHDSQPCGTGYQLHPNGNTYVGSFKDGTKSGQGSYYWFSSGQMYTGEWLGGLPHGNGKYLSADYYEGSFCNGMKYGHGQQVFLNGDRYVGQYINGVADGYGQYFWADGSTYKGDFKHGVRHGYGIWLDKKQTQIYSGCYRMDKKQGFGVYQWVGKQVYKGQFREDFRQGYGRLYQMTPKLAPDSTQQSLVLQERVLFQGMWYKGKQKPDLAVDQQAIKRLDSFIVEKKLSSPKKKKRVGHQHCIPKQF